MIIYYGMTIMWMANTLWKRSQRSLSLYLSLSLYIYIYIYIYIYVIHKCLIHSPYLFDFSKVLVHGWHSDSRTDLRSNKVSVLSLNKLCYFTGEYKFRILLNAPKYFLLKIEVGLFKTCKMPVTFIIQSSTDALIVNAIWYVSNMVWRRNQSNYSLLPFISGP